MKSNASLDLDNARTSRESRVFSGRERGIECRKMFGLDKLDKSPEPVTVSIPRDIYSMNTSFFLGLFGESVRTLGKEGFIAKYQFVCDDVHQETVSEGIDRALKEGSIFDKGKMSA